MDLNTRHISQQLLVQLLHVLVMRQVVLHHRHLPTADTCADVGHPIIIADLLVLIVRIALAVLRSVHHDPAPLIIRRSDERAATGGGDHLVAVERQHAELSEGAAAAPGKFGAHGLGGVLNHGDVVLGGHLHDAVDLGGHAVEVGGDDGFGLAAGAGFAVGALRMPTMANLSSNFRHLRGLHELIFLHARVDALVDDLSRQVDQDHDGPR